MSAAAESDAATIRVVLPAHLRSMAKVQGEVHLAITGDVTQRSVLDALEGQFPMLLGTIRDRSTAKRRQLGSVSADARALASTSRRKAGPAPGCRRKSTMTT